MEQLSGIPIPVDEIPGQAQSTETVSKTKIPVGGTELGKAANWQNNSVASLFASRMDSEGDSEL
jgi:hypothetical protein